MGKLFTSLFRLFQRIVTSYTMFNICTLSKKEQIPPKRLFYIYTTTASIKGHIACF